MNSAEHLRTVDVAAAYERRAEEYVGAFGDVERASPFDAQLIANWALEVSGDILDLGSGPGHWTDFMWRARSGAADAQDGDAAPPSGPIARTVRGIDPTPAFVECARARFAHLDFAQGSADRIDAHTASLGGVLAWYSLIHTHPDTMDAALREIARTLRPGGSLLIGFFRGDRIEPFDHAVVTAWLWPVDALDGRLTTSGFDVVSHEQRRDPGARPHGSIIARRRP